MTVGRTGLLVAAVSVAVLAGGCGTRAAESKAKPPPPPKPHHTVVLATGAGRARHSSATTHGAIPGSPEPGAPENQLVPASWYGYPSILAVVTTVPNWVEVRLAQRPNGSTTWVPQSDVTLTATPYLIVVNLSTEHLTVDKYGQQVMDFPAGIGTPDDPTVTGDYFVTMTVPAPSPGYGPFVLVTSAHSDSITDWAASGDAIIAIHGPITSYDDSLIGTTGAAISHGCIRLHDADLGQLGVIPPGTPVDVISGQPA